MKRTTLLLEPGLYAALKKAAAAEGRTLTDVVERALRMGLAAQAAGRRVRLALPSYDLGPFLLNPGDRHAVGALRPAEADSRQPSARERS